MYDQLYMIKGLRWPFIDPPDYIPDCGLSPKDNCTFQNIEKRFVYLWLEDDTEFWFCPTRHDNNKTAGYAWISGEWQPVLFDFERVRTFHP